MIDNLFSIFNPIRYLNLRFNWVSIILCFFFIPLSCSLIFSRESYIFKLLNNYLEKDIKNNLKSYLWSNLIFFIRFFFFIRFNNFLGLFPYIFTSTRHLVVTIGLCLPIWLRIVIKGLMYNFYRFMRHLVPKGTPFQLIPLMVIIERTRILIRPVTLSVRLGANIIAGHLLIVLLRNLIRMGFIYFIFSLPIIWVLLILEMRVSLIQAYVFIVLLSLYLNEIRF